MQYFSETVRILLLTIFASLLLTACGAKKMNGSFVGAAKADLRIANTSSDYPEILTDFGYDALAIITPEDSNAVTLRFGNTALLKNCELKAKVKNTSIDIAEGAICETDIAGMSRIINISGGEIYVSDSADAEATIKVYGFSGRSLDGDAFSFSFQGKSVK